MEISDWAVLGVFGVLLITYVGISLNRIEKIIAIHSELLKDFELPALNMDEIGENIENVVHDLLENIHIPTPGDMAMQMGLQFLANKFGLGPGSIPVIEEDVDILADPSELYGTKENEA